MLKNRILDAVHYYFFVDVYGSDGDGLDNIVQQYKGKISPKFTKMLHAMSNDFYDEENLLSSKHLHQMESKDYKKLANYIKHNEIVA